MAGRGWSGGAVCVRVHAVTRRRTNHAPPPPFPPACAQAEAQHYSLRALDRRCAQWFYLHDLLNVFIGGMLGGSAASGMQAFLNSPGSFFKILGSAVPASANFFISFVEYRMLAMTAFRLF